MEYGILFISLAVSFVLQVFPRFRLKEFGIDTWRWLLYAEEIRNNGFRLPKFIDRYIIKAPYSYPPLLHYCLALFSKKFRERYNYIFSPFFSILENILVVVIVYKMTSDFTAALISSFVFSAVTVNILQGNNLNTRHLGNLLYTVTCIALYAYVFLGASPVYYVLSLIPLLIGHRMSTQIALFQVLAVSLFLKDIVPLGGFALAVLLTYAVTFGHYHYILKGHIVQIVYWYKQIMSRKADIRFSLKELVVQYGFKNLVVVSAIALYVFKGAETDFDKALMFNTFFVLIVALVTFYIIPLRCVGEGPRYLNYASASAAVYLALHCNIGILAFVCLLSALIAFVRQYGIYRLKIDTKYLLLMTDNIKAKLGSCIEGKGNVNFMSYPPSYDDYVAYKYENTTVMFHDNGFALEKCYMPLIGKPASNEEIQRRIDLYSIDVFVSEFEYELSGFLAEKTGSVIFYERVKA